MKKIIASTLCIAVLGACAKHTAEIRPSYVSPLQYSNYDCEQMRMEMMRLSRKLSDLGAQVEKTANSDDTEMGVGMILLWPTLFWLDGDTPEAAEYARLNGEFDALEQAAIQKKCGFEIERPKIVVEKPESNPRPAPSQTRKR